MDTNILPVNYQRAITPSIDNKNVSNISVSGTQVRGKTLSYSQQSIRKTITSNGPLSNLPLDPSKNNTSSRTYVSLNGGSLPVSSPIISPNPMPPTPTRVLQRGMIGSPLSNTSNLSNLLNLQGKSMNGSSPTAQSSLNMKFQENNEMTTSTHITSTTDASSENISSDIIPIHDDIPSDGIIFARYKNRPESVVVYRTSKERTRNPERLNLDRRQLEICPILEQESRLRLLNYQNNNIRLIENIENLQNLIFLDLYNNKIISLDGPLSLIKGLRVLMAGKNRISYISNINTLKRLDVLDLHSNDIRLIQGLDNLSEIRVLNLAGNKISIVSNLSSLQSLTELNLRRNNIEKVLELDRLPALQRVFLSHNRISSIEDMQCVFHIKLLMELSLDNNPISENNSSFRQFIINSIPSLRYFDSKSITDEDRESALRIEETRTTNMAINMNSIESMTRTIESIGQDHSREENRQSNRENSLDLNRFDILSSSYHHKNDTEIDRNDRDDRNISLLETVRQGKIPNQSNLFEIENLSSGNNSLVLVGELWEWPSNKQQLAHVTEMTICCLSHNLIATLMPTNFAMIFPSLRILRLIRNDIHSIVDFEMMTVILTPTIEELEIYENIILSPSVTSMIQSYVVTKLPNIKTLNKVSLQTIDRNISQKLIQPILDTIAIINQPNTNSKSKSIPRNSMGKDMMEKITKVTIRKRELAESFDKVFQLAFEEIVKKAIDEFDS